MLGAPARWACRQANASRRAPPRRAVALAAGKVNSNANAEADLKGGSGCEPGRKSSFAEWVKRR